MTTATYTRDRNHLFTYDDLRAYLEAHDGWECHVYSYGYEDKDTCEDPIVQIFGIDETIEWIKENPAYLAYRSEMIGYMVVFFDHNRDFVDEVIF